MKTAARKMNDNFQQSHDLLCNVNSLYIQVYLKFKTNLVNSEPHARTQHTHKHSFDFPNNNDIVAHQVPNTKLHTLSTSFCAKQM